jgi:hypothetical protein
MLIVSVESFTVKGLWPRRKNSISSEFQTSPIFFSIFAVSCFSFIGIEIQAQMSLYIVNDVDATKSSS